MQETGAGGQETEQQKECLGKMYALLVDIKKINVVTNSKVIETNKKVADHNQKNKEAYQRLEERMQQIQGKVQQNRTP